MKLTRRVLRRLILEAVKRRAIFPNPDNPVTQSELDQIRKQSRIRAGIPDDAQEKIQGLESPKLPDQIASKEDINQARWLAKALGSKQGEISAQQEEDFFHVLGIHEILPTFEPILGQAVYKATPSFLKLLKKVYQSLILPGNYEIWIYDTMTFQGQPDQEPKDVVLEKLKKGDYIIYSFGRERSDYEMYKIKHQDFTDLQKELSQVLPLPSDYYIFKILTHIRPDLNVWSAN